MSEVANITLTTSDKKKFVVAISLARRCALFERMFARGPVLEVVPLVIHSSILAKIIDFLSHCGEEAELSSSARSNDWYYEFLDANHNILEELYETSNYLGLAGLSKICKREITAAEEPMPCSSRSVNIRNVGRIYSAKTRRFRFHKRCLRHSPKTTSVHLGSGRSDQKCDDPNTPFASSDKLVMSYEEKCREARAQLEFEAAMRHETKKMRIEDCAAFEEESAAILSSMSEFVSKKNAINRRHDVIDKVDKTINEPEAPMAFEDTENDGDVLKSDEVFCGQIKEEAFKQGGAVPEEYGDGEEEEYHPPQKKSKIL